LIRKVYDDDLGPPAIAAVAKYVQQAHDDGDPIAAGILNRAADELVMAATAVMTGLDLSDKTFTFVLAGGMFHAIPWFYDELRTLLPARAPRSQVIRLDREPALGAVHFALAELRGGARLPVYRT